MKGARGQSLLLKQHDFQISEIQWLRSIINSYKDTNLFYDPAKKSTINYTDPNWFKCNVCEAGVVDSDGLCFQY